MNVTTILNDGHAFFEAAYSGVAADRWERPGVTGTWSPKDVVAHVGSFELVLTDILSSLLGPGPTPNLDAMRTPGGDFNDSQVERRRPMSVDDVVREYCDAHERNIALSSELPDGLAGTPGTMPWYGEQYALDDLVAYMYYGHKREHGAQIAESVSRG